MRVSVKTSQVYLEIRGAISESLLELLRLEYGRRLRVRSEWGERMTDILNAPMYELEPIEMRPGDYLRFYRQDKDLTQGELGQKLGGIPRQNICSMESGRRPISRAMALTLSRFFNVSPARFIG